MLKQIVRSLRRRVGPVGLSLVAAALTAVAFAAVSVAKDDSGSKQQSAPGAAQAGPGGPPMTFQLNLSDEDKQKLEDFRQCMTDQGVDAPPAPPEPGEDGTFKRRVKPPSEEERQKMDKAFEACQDKLPEGAQAFGHGPCGPPPGPPPGEQGATPPQQGQGSNQDQGYAVPAPQGASS